MKQPPYRAAHRANSKTRSLLLAIAVLSIHGVGDSAAQTIRSLEPGTRVRVRMTQATRTVVASIVGARPDTLLLARPSSLVESMIPLAVSDIRTLEISAGRRHLVPHGVILGFLLGSALVGGYNSILQSQCFTNCPDPVPFTVGGLVGGIAGGVGFSFIRADRWVEVALPRRSPPPAGVHPRE
jgi:hypothetical protein